MLFYSVHFQTGAKLAGLKFGQFCAEKKDVGISKEILAMSKLQSKLAKSGIELKAQTAKSSKSKVAALKAPKAVSEAVDNYLLALEAEKEASARKANASSALQSFYLDHVFEEKDTESAMIEGTKGAVNVVFKSQYTMKTPEVLKEVMKSQGMDFDEHVTTHTSVVINFDAMSEGEMNKLVALIKGFGQERASALIEEKTSYKVSESFTKQMAKVKDREAFDALREASGHFTPTVSARKS